MSESIVDVPSLLQSMAEKVDELWKRQGIEDYEIIGIRTGGVWLAQAMRELLGRDAVIGELDISFYRDDFTRMGLNPSVKPSSLPFDTEGKHLLLVDDVVMSGRTIRAAMNELFDFGRPNSILYCALADVGGRELPIQPDVLGCALTLKPGSRVKLVGPDPLSLEVRETGAC